MCADRTHPSNWRMIVQSLTRPYPVRAQMVVLLALVPLYIAIAKAVAGRRVHIPAVSLDRLLPLMPTWGLVYGALYLVLIALPIFIVREDLHIRRLFLAYVAVWLTAYACFLLYPTAAPRPPKIDEGGFVAWGLQFLYSADPPYNCFPSLHVAHSVVSALVCYRVHRRVGVMAILCASLVAVSTLFTKQHYVLDVVAGVLLGCLAHATFFRGVPRAKVPDIDRQLAPIFALGTLAIAGISVTSFWVAYRLSVGHG